MTKTRFIAILAMLIILSLASIAQAAPVTLAWNPNTESDLAGYRIYWGDASRSYTAHVDVPAAANEQKQATIDITPEDGRTVYFAATAYDEAGNESDYSNEVTWTVADHEAPGVPGGFRIVVEVGFGPGGEPMMKFVKVERAE